MSKARDGKPLGRIDQLPRAVYHYGQQDQANLSTSGSHQESWATPNTMDHLPMRSEEAKDRQFSTTRKGRTAPANLREQVLVESYPQAMWATPAVRDYKDTGDLSKSQWRKDGKERNDTLGRQAYGSTAQTENKGSLNPQFPCWLMGIPQVWLSSMQQAMQSFRK